VKSPVLLTTPLTDKAVESLKAGDNILLNGVLITARDAAHKRLVEEMDRGGTLPIELSGQVIYYVGPSPARPGRPIGSAGPTTSYRMDAYAIRLMEKGIKGMIGKGKRSTAVIEAMKKYKCVYFAAVGGAGALLAKRITACELVAYGDLGPEAIRKLMVKDFPVIVINDIFGGDAYIMGMERFKA